MSGQSGYVTPKKGANFTGTLDRWHDPEQLRRDHDAALRLIDRQGIIRSTDKRWVSEAKAVFLKIIVSLQGVIMGSTLSHVFCYDQNVQPPAIARCDGWASVSERQSSGRQVSAVGISIQALQAGESYAALILLHELCHVLHGFPAHGPEFHKRLDRLIGTYNAATGSHIENDYFGFGLEESDE